jgi:hypothetical protein
MNTNHRPIYVIAREIGRDWKAMNYAARPYYEAMQSLDTIADSYGMDSAKSIIRYFLANASTWKGEIARQIKSELNSMIK